MKRSKFSEEQVAYALRQAEAGTAVVEVCWQLGVSEATFYVWKKKYAHRAGLDVVWLHEEADGTRYVVLPSGTVVVEGWPWTVQGQPTVLLSSE